jgi:NADPH2:quinone reductase
MRAARCEQYGGPDSVVVRDLPAPQLRPGHVLVDVAAAAVNFSDLLILADRYQVSVPVPFTVGSEFAGTVAEVAADVVDLKAGDRVWGASMSGTMAERVRIPARDLAPVPDGLDLIEAAAFRVSYLTAYHSLVTAGGLGGVGRRPRRGRWSRLGHGRRRPSARCSGDRGGIVA